GAISANIGQIDRAIINYQKALEINPDDIQVHTDLGHLYLTKRMYDKAQREFEKVLTLDPDNIDVKKFYKILKSQGG
ncbi:MAG: tetratricopeptide repeat protein, partial [Elusimicrobiota bacterium]